MKREYAWFRFSPELGGGFAFWDISIAELCVRDGMIEDTIEIDREQMEIIARENEWDEAQLDSVDPTIPGIAAPVLGPDGEIGYVLIDGHHRNARAVRDGLGFRAHLLTDEASRESLLFGPEERMPWRDSP